MNYPCTGINTYHPMEVGALSGTSASYSDEGLAGAGEGYGGEIGAVPENSWYPSWSEETAWGAERLTTPNVQEDVDLHTWFCHGAPQETWGNTWSARQPNDHLEWYEGTPWTPTTTITTLPSSSHFSHGAQNTYTVASSASQPASVSQHHSQETESNFWVGCLSQEEHASMAQEGVAGILVDSGASCHACPLWFGNDHFPLRKGPGDMKALPSLWATNGQDMAVHGFRTAHLDVDGSLRLETNFIVVNATNPILSIRKLQQRGISICFDKDGARLFKGRDTVHLHLEGKLFWLRPLSFAPPPSDLTFARVPAAINMRDYGPTDEWRLDYNVLARIHRRHRRALCTPSQTVHFPEGVHFGILGPARKTFLTFEDGAREVFTDTWSAGEKSRVLKSWWTGETHFDLLVEGKVAQELPSPPLLPPGPPGLADSSSSSSSGLSWAASEVGRLIARRLETGNDFWRVIGDALERIHVVPSDTLQVPKHCELPVELRRILSSRMTLAQSGTSYLDYVDDWTSVSGSPSLSSHLPSIRTPWTGLTRFRIGP